MGLPGVWISRRSTYLGETGPLSQGVQACRKALRIRHINGVEVRKKRLRGFKREAQGVRVSPLNPLSVSPCAPHAVVAAEIVEHAPGKTNRPTTARTTDSLHAC